MISGLSTIAQGIGQDLKRLRLTPGGQDRLINTIGLMASEILGGRIPKSRAALARHAREAVSLTGFDPLRSLNYLF
ncbi:MAG: hypothetical protein AB7P76_09750 [Candidatus Melainabacteria bacterium]